MFRGGERRGNYALAPSLQGMAGNPGIQAPGRQSGAVSGCTNGILSSQTVRRDISHSLTPHRRLEKQAAPTATERIAQARIAEPKQKAGQSAAEKEKRTTGPRGPRALRVRSVKPVGNLSSEWEPLPFPFRAGTWGKVGVGRVKHLLALLQRCTLGACISFPPFPPDLSARGGAGGGRAFAAPSRSLVFFQPGQRLPNTLAVAVGKGNCRAGHVCGASEIAAAEVGKVSCAGVEPFFWGGGALFIVDA